MRNSNLRYEEESNVKVMERIQVKIDEILKGVQEEYVTLFTKIKDACNSQEDRSSKGNSIPYQDLKEYVFNLSKEDKKSLMECLCMEVHKSVYADNISHYSYEAQETNMQKVFLSLACLNVFNLGNKKVERETLKKNLGAIILEDTEALESYRAGFLPLDIEFIRVNGNSDETVLSLYYNIQYEEIIYRYVSLDFEEQKKKYHDFIGKSFDDYLAQSPYDFVEQVQNNGDGKKLFSMVLAFVHSKDENKREKMLGFIKHCIENEDLSEVLGRMFNWMTDYRPRQSTTDDFKDWAEFINEDYTYLEKIALSQKELDEEDKIKITFNAGLVKNLNVMAFLKVSCFQDYNIYKGWSSKTETQRYLDKEMDTLVDILNKGGAKIELEKWTESYEIYLSKEDGELANVINRFLNDLMKNCFDSVYDINKSLICVDEYLMKKDMESHNVTRKAKGLKF